MNAPYYSLENEWADLYSPIQDVDPRLPPTISWTGEELQKHFSSLKTKSALVDECFCFSGNLEAGTDIKEADHFDGHIRRLLQMKLQKYIPCFNLHFGHLTKKLPYLFHKQNPQMSNLILGLSSTQ